MLVECHAIATEAKWWLWGITERVHEPIQHLFFPQEVGASLGDLTLFMSALGHQIIRPPRFPAAEPPIAPGTSARDVGAGGEYRYSPGIWRSLRLAVWIDSEWLPVVAAVQPENEGVLHLDIAEFLKIPAMFFRVLPRRGTLQRNSHPASWPWLAGLIVPGLNSSCQTFFALLQAFELCGTGA